MAFQPTGRNRFSIFEALGADPSRRHYNARNIVAEIKSGGTAAALPGAPRASR